MPLRLTSDDDTKLEAAVNSLVEVLDALKEAGVQFNERASVELEYAKSMLGTETEAERRANS